MITICLHANMDLEKFLINNDISVATFAQNVGVTRPAIYNYIHGKKIPSRRVMQAIYKATKKAVTPNDFYGIASTDEAGHD